MGEGTGGSNTADSYIGSLISLTSKSEIRYEGILYTVDTENSNIALQNVRSYGTEGRKKDGPQILAGDKVYDYIIFRGSDIKDLQVKSSPVSQTPTPGPTDPAIISLQSQYAPSSAAIAPAYLTPQVGPLVDGTPSSTFSGASASSFRGGVQSLYQAGSMGSWGLPPPGSNGTGLAVPLYWQGYYRPSPLQSHIHHQHLPQPPPSLPAPPHLFQVASRSFPRPELSSSSRGTEIDLQASQPYCTSVSAPPSILSPLAANPGSFGISQVPSVPAQSAPPTTSLSPAQAVEANSDVDTVSAALLPVTVPDAVHGVSAVITPAAKTPRRVVAPPRQTQAQALSSLSTSSLSASSVQAVCAVNPVSSPRVQSDPASSSDFAVAATKNAVQSRLQKVERRGPESQKTGQQPFIRSSMDKQIHFTSQPLLPLPTTTAQGKHVMQGTGTIGVPGNYSRRGKFRGGSGKGVVLLHATQHFTEDFDFTAMNKKFNKDEVWGELGAKGEYREKTVEPEEERANNCDETPEGHSHSLVSEPQKWPVYVKDDFFDSLSCDSLEREGRADRMKFSEQRRIDTETFGNFPLRSRVGRGRAVGRRGGYRGGYYSSQSTDGGRSSLQLKGRGPV